MDEFVEMSVGYRDESHDFWTNQSKCHLQVFGLVVAFHSGAVMGPMTLTFGRISPNVIFKCSVGAFQSGAVTGSMAMTFGRISPNVKEFHGIAAVIKSR